MTRMVCVLGGVDAYSLGRHDTYLRLAFRCVCCHVSMSRACLLICLGLHLA
jgi:hypothetical protein